MFRPLLGHLQALWENRFKSCLYSNALWDPKYHLQAVLENGFKSYPYFNALKYTEWPNKVYTHFDMQNITL